MLSVVVILGETFYLFCKDPSFQCKRAIKMYQFLNVTLLIPRNLLYVQ